VSARTVGRMKKELPPQLVKKELPNQLDAKLLGWMNNLPPKCLNPLGNSGEPFWVKTTKSNISASQGQRMCRKHGKSLFCDFSKIQVRHGETECLDELVYLNCPYGKNIVLPYVYASLRNNENYQHKEYLIKTPYGMIANSEKNGGALLVWYEKTS